MVTTSTGQQVPPAALPPGTERPRRFRPRLRWELVQCATGGHELVGADVARLRAEDALVARDEGPVRWLRCLRCDSWLPLPPPERPAAETLPPLGEIDPPLRGKPLRDRYVLRLIAIDRALHFLVLSSLAAAIFLFVSHRQQLDSFLTRFLSALQGGIGGPVQTHHGVLYDLSKLTTVKPAHLYEAGAAVAAYALLEGVEAVGLWIGKRWAEYLTFIATIVFIPYEVYELTKTVSYLKVLTLVINVAIAVYLLFAKRLFGLRGGRAAEEREREHDMGWPAIVRATWWLDPAGPVPGGPAARR